MKKMLAFIFAMSTLIANAHEISAHEFSELFKHFDGCFILYSMDEHKIISEYNPNNRCSQRISPNSTFKIPLSVMAFDQGIIHQNTVFKWTGEKGVLPEHEQDQTPKSWLQYSVVWLSQQLTPKLGYDRIKHYLADFHYGNQDFTGDPGKHNGLQYAWIASSLKISAIEELQFLKNMLSHQLQVKPDAIENTKSNLYLGKLKNGADYYGKTGAGRHGRSERLENPSPLRDGWFVGFIQKGTASYIFVSNLTDKEVPAATDTFYGSQILKPITIKLLNDYFET